MITLTNTCKVFSKEVLAEIVAAIFILLFVYTASSKLMDLQKFRIAISDSPLIGRYALTVSLVIPFAELIASIILFFPRTRKQGLLLCLFLMIIFTVYTSYMILFSPHLPCSCGGVIQQLSWNGHLALNLLLTALAATAVYKHKLFIAINRSLRKPAKE